MFMNFIAFNNFLRIKNTCSFPFQSSCKFPKLPCLILKKKVKCKGEQINLKT